jgi:glycine dehydrogenase subunit 1
MTEWRDTVHPYIPNSDRSVKAEMLAAIGASSVEELYSDVPDAIRLKRPLDLPRPLPAEADLVRHMEGILAKNRTVRDYLSFLGAGCAPHYIPAVCDEVNSRGEFLTAHSGHPYEDHGRFQAIFEYQSMMGELLEMDAVNVPTYDGFQAAATGLRMSARLTDRHRVLVSAHVSLDQRSKIFDYVRSDIEVGLVPHESSTGLIDLDSLARLLDDSVAGVFVENPTYLGVIEPRGEEIARLTHAAGAVLVVGVDPISLGVLRPPAAYGADIATGDIQPLGIHLQYGGGLGGFIATSDDRRHVMEYPSRLFALAPTKVEGEYGFGEVLFAERTSFGQREHGKEWAGTVALWALTAGVYLALMGPRGMVEVGEGIMARVRYAMNHLATVPGVRIPFARQHHFKEFVVDFGETGRTVADINRTLLARGIFGGKDLSEEFPELGSTALYCVTEVHTRADIDRLAAELTEVLS